MGILGIGFENCISIDGCIYFPSIVGDGLFKYDSTGVEYLGELTAKKHSLSREYGELLYKDGALYAVPHAAWELVKYDLKTKEFERHFLDFGGEELTSRIYRSFICDERLIMLPTRFHGIVEVDLCDYSVRIVDQWMDGFSPLADRINDLYFRSGILHDNIIYAPFCNLNAVMKYCITTGNVEIIRVGTTGYSSICIDNDNSIWLFPRKGESIIKWELGNDKYNSYGIPVNCRNSTYVGCMAHGKSIWAFPETGNMVLRIETVTGEIHEDERFREICNSEYNNASSARTVFSYAGLHEGKIIASTGNTSELVILDLERNVIQRQVLQVPRDYLNSYREALIQRNRAVINSKTKSRILNERDKSDLERFVSDVSYS